MHETMIADYHVHTPYCGHARGKTIQYAERAVELGLDELCFTDHLGRYYLSRSQRRRYWDWGIDGAKLERYIAELEDIEALFAGTLTVKTGLEADFVEGAEELLEPLLDRFPLDFVLGSVHCLPRFGWHHLTRYARKPPEDLYREYLTCAQAAAASGLFDSLAHLDFIWRYVPWPAALTDEIRARIDDIVAAAKASGTAVEVNANGYLWSTLSPEDGPNPFGHMAACIARHGAVVTLGSDAHSPAAVGAAFDEIVPYLANRGISAYRLYRHREARTVALG
ncbi:MAG: histidinol-phosphatase HisJ family protein [Chitinivibrionales bacterium]|nr:histidinol-phosphatase HisJ family protein [Chitinivibrionales bacterium]